MASERRRRVPLTEMSELAGRNGTRNSTTFPLPRSFPSTVRDRRWRRERRTKQLTPVLNLGLVPPTALHILEVPKRELQLVLEPIGAGAVPARCDVDTRQSWINYGRRLPSQQVATAAGIPRVEILERCSAVTWYTEHSSTKELGRSAAATLPLAHALARRTSRE